MNNILEKQEKELVEKLLILNSIILRKVLSLMQKQNKAN